MRRAPLAVAAALVVCATRAAQAEPSTRPAVTLGAPAPAAGTSLVWKPAWRKFDRQDAALTATTAVGTLVFAFTTKEAPPDYRGPVLFDDEVRGVVRASSSTARQNAERVGDMLYRGTLLYPFVVDVFGVAFLARRSAEVASQMALIDTEAFAITGFLGFAANAGIRRQRPEQPGCETGRGPSFPTCRGNSESDTFFSGRTSIVFTGAALTCAHHYYLPLYGESRVGDVVACAGLMAAATTGGAMRLRADQHYVSDVLVGAGVGLSSGLLVPWFHYRGTKAAQPAATATDTRAATTRWVAMPMLSPTVAGLGAVGSF